MKQDEFSKYDITDSFQDMMKTQKAKKFKKIILIEIVVIGIMVILLALTK